MHTWTNCGPIVMWRVEDLMGSAAYLDSNVLIYAFEGRNDRPLHRALAQLFRSSQERRINARTSLLTRSEVLVRPLREGDARLADWYRRLLSGRGAIGMLAVSRPIADGAAELRAAMGSLRLPDALHLASAIKAGCDVLITGDGRLATAAARHMRSLTIKELTA
ncbi:MAG: type II toxin-antitoxin system VapC family toxin [Gammaproteobacteria bacterium]